MVREYYHKVKMKKENSSMKGTIFGLNSSDTHSSNATIDVLDEQLTQALESLELFDLVEERTA